MENSVSVRGKSRGYVCESPLYQVPINIDGEEEDPID